MIAARDPLGATRVFVALDGASGAEPRWAHAVRPLLGAQPALDREGVRAAWGLVPEAARGGVCTRTCFIGVRALPIGYGLLALDPVTVAPVPTSRASGSLSEALLGWAEKLPSGCAVALSGGLDSTLVLALLRALGRAAPRVVTLRTPFREYDERDEVDAAARTFGARVEPIEVREADVLEAVDEAVETIETCLYNLHPIGRYLLARGAAGLGVRDLVTGDGADQLLARRPSERLLPLVGALVARAGATLRSPFLDPEVQAATPAAPDPGKRALRAVARQLSARGEAWADRPKRPRLMPPTALDARLDRGALTALARAFELPLSLDDDAARVRWLTLASLSRTFGATRCVG